MTVSINATAITFNDDTSQNTAGISNVVSLASGNGVVTVGANTTHLRFKRLSAGGNTAISSNSSTVIFTYTTPPPPVTCPVGGS